MLEHAAKGFLQMNLENKLEQKTSTIDIAEHKGTIPQDLKFITQIAAEKEGVYSLMRASTNPFMTSICSNNILSPCPKCQYEFTVSPSGVLTTNLHTGKLTIAYLAYPVDEDGQLLIPNDETIKEALTHYVLYKYWLTKDMMKEEGASQRMSFHLNMWSTLSKKALNANLPDVSVLENIKNNHNSLVPNSRKFDQLFTTLGQGENLKF